MKEAGLRVDPIAGHFAQIFRRRDLVSFDLIYAAGLFDYLDQAACRKLTNHLFGRLQRDGRLIVANFLSGQRCRGYMELMMDWHLVHRDRSEIEDFAAMIDPTKIAEANYFVEPTGTIGFLELTRR